MATNTTSTLSGQYQTYFSKQLLDYAVQETRLNEFAMQADLPKNVGAKTVTFARWGAPSVSAIETLTEGTKPTGTRSLTLTTVEVTLTHYGEYAVLTDLLSYTELYNSLKAGVKLMGQDAALYSDDLITTELVANGTKVYAQQGATGTYAGLAAAQIPNAKFVANDALDIVTRLKVNRAKPFNGDYVAIISPQVSIDVMKDPDWKNASLYGATQQLFKGELGRLYGVRYVEATNPFIESSGGSEGTEVSDGDIFSTIFTGQQAYGSVKLSGDSPFRPQVIIVDTPDSNNPLNQTKTAGWKFYYAAKSLNADWYRVYKSKSTFNA